ncbi:MAG: hypothetical protein ACI87E_003074 [Mariniblastus sp.]|jgi:hypothetical protein
MLKSDTWRGDRSCRWFWRFTRIEQWWSRACCDGSLDNDRLTASLLGGKYLSVELQMREIESQSIELTEDDFTFSFADNEAFSQIEAGKQLQWARGVNYETVNELEDFPKTSSTRRSNKLKR